MMLSYTLSSILVFSFPSQPDSWTKESGRTRLLLAQNTRTFSWPDSCEPRRFVNTFNFSDKGMLEAATAVLVERKKTNKEDLGPKIRLDLLNGAIGGADMSNRRCRFRCKNEEWVYCSCSRNSDKYVTSSPAIQLFSINSFYVCKHTFHVIAPLSVWLGILEEGDAAKSFLSLSANSFTIVSIICSSNFK